MHWRVTNSLSVESKSLEETNNYRENHLFFNDDIQP